MTQITGGTDDSTSAALNNSTLVFGIMGIGTFLLFFFFIVVAIIWVFSTPCATGAKVLSRVVSVVIFLVVFLVLIFADRQSQYKTNGFEVEIYDNSVIPRIVLVLIMSIFSIVALLNLLAHSGESRKLSTIDVEPTALWEN